MQRTTHCGHSPRLLSPILVSRLSISRSCVRAHDVAVTVCPVASVLHVVQFIECVCETVQRQRVCHTLCIWNNSWRAQAVLFRSHRWLELNERQCFLLAHGDMLVLAPVEERPVVLGLAQSLRLS